MVRSPYPSELVPALPPQFDPFLYCRRYCDSVLVVGERGLNWQLVFPRAAVDEEADSAAVAFEYDVVLDRRPLRLRERIQSLSELLSRVRDGGVLVVWQRIESDYQLVFEDRGCVWCGGNGVIFTKERWT